MYAHLNGVAHRCEFHHGDVRLRNESHIQKMLAQRALAADGADDGALAGRKGIEGHIESLLRMFGKTNKLNGKNIEISPA